MINKKAFKKVLKIFSFIPAYLLSKLNIRVLKIIHPHSFGHLILEPASYLMEKKLNNFRHKHVILLIPICKKTDKLKPLNHAMIEYWKDFFYVITSKKLYTIFNLLWENQCIRFDMSSYVMNTGSMNIESLAKVTSAAKFYLIQSNWRDNSPILTLKNKHEIEGYEILYKLGLPEKAWFVVFFSRELQGKEFSYRNSDINKYYKALKLIVEKGGWCIRLGVKQSPPLSKKIHQLKNIIDYAQMDSHPHWMDLFLCSKALFYIGNSSGLSNLPVIFGTPVVLVNVIPLSTAGASHKDIFLPKLLASKDGKLIPFSKIFSSDIANTLYLKEYNEKGIQIVDNSEEEISEAVKEMFDLLENKLSYSNEEEQLQKKYKSFFKPNHYGYKNSARVGKNFLKKYSHLLEN